MRKQPNPQPPEGAMKPPAPPAPPSIRSVHIDTLPYSPPEPGLVIHDPISREDWLEKTQFIYEQMKQLKHENSITCECGKLVQIQHAYKCLYCGEWYCKECAEVHFGKTVDQYRKEHPIEGMY